MKKKVPFPQANSVERIYEVFISISDDGISKYDMKNFQSLAERQGAYYLDALLFLGFVDKINTKYFLSQKGNKLRRTCELAGKTAFAIKIIEIDFFAVIFKEKHLFSKKGDYIEFITSKIENEYGLGKETAKRRASTVASWLDWIENSIKEQ